MEVICNLIIKTQTSFLQNKATHLLIIIQD